MCRKNGMKRRRICGRASCLCTAAVLCALLLTGCGGGFAVKDGILTAYTGKSAQPVIPKDVTAIGEGAFANNPKIRSIVIPASVTSISYGAFESCKALESVTIEGPVTEILPDTFFNCTSLSAVILPDTVESIGMDAFGETEALKKLTVPDGIRKIDKKAFDGSGMEKWVRDIFPSSHAREMEEGEKIAVRKGETILPVCREVRDERLRDEDDDRASHIFGDLYVQMPPGIRTLNRQGADYFLIVQYRSEYRGDYTGAAYNMWTEVYLESAYGNAHRLLWKTRKAPPANGYGTLFGKDATAEEIWEAVEPLLDVEP